MLSSTWQWLGRVPDVEVQWCNQIRRRTWLGFEVGLAVGEAWGDWGVTHTLGWSRTFRHVNFSRAGIGSDAAKEKHFEFNSCCQAAPSVSCPFELGSVAPGFKSRWHSLVGRLRERLAILWGPRPTPAEAAPGLARRSNRDFA